MSLVFQIRITRRAKQDIREAMSFLRKVSPRVANKWFRELEILISGLNEMPTRFSIIPEAHNLGKPYRSTLHHSHRIIYRIDELNALVYIVRIYHGNRKPIEDNDVTEF